MNKVAKYLADFKASSDAWFKNNDWLESRFLFFQNFFKPENLSSATWEDFQKMGDNLHCFNSLAIAKKNALGNPNHPIEHYRKAFEYLARGTDDINLRLNNLKDPKSDYYIRYFGNSSLSELAAYANPDAYVMYNKRDIRALEFLDIPVVTFKKETFGDTFKSYNEAIRPILNSYKEIVGQKTNTTFCLELDQFFSWLYFTIIRPQEEESAALLEEDGAVDSGVEDPAGSYTTKRYWLIAPGEGSSAWDEFYENGIIAVGWNQVGDLSRFSSKAEIKKALKEAFPESNTSHMNNSLCLWQFSQEMKSGDIVIAKGGLWEYVGYGIISGDYYFDDSRSDYKNVRKVDWKKKGRWEENTAQIVLKTLTDITKYPEYVDRLKRLIGIEQEATVENENVSYFWLNANPKYWRIQDFQIGGEQSYTTHNEIGNKRQRFEHFQAIKEGDLILGYETSPVKKVVAIFEVLKGRHIDEDDGHEKITFKIQKFLPDPVSWEKVKEMPELQNSEVVKSNQGSLFKLTKEEYNAIINREAETTAELPKYTLQIAQSEIFLDPDQIETILDTLEYKKNIIMQGPPGVGKTYLAKRLAYLAMEVKDSTRVEMIQFHQSYSYEDFIQGYRPKEDGGFKLENGIFYRFCKRAQADPENNYYFIIDEINRGNLSKIFGELMLLIDADKRGSEFAVPLTYSASVDTKFFVPENLYMIGTMNTADRSLAVVDYALRRRFAFISVPPTFNQKLRQQLISNGLTEKWANTIFERITELNAVIEKDLGGGFRIGHSYFCNIPKESDNLDWYNGIVKHEIEPLIREYWFDNEEKANREVENLRIY